MVTTIASLALIAVLLPGRAEIGRVEIERQPSTVNEVNFDAAGCIFESVRHASDGRLVTIRATVGSQCNERDFDGTAFVTLGSAVLAQQKLDQVDLAQMTVVIPADLTRGALMCVGFDGAAMKPQATSTSPAEAVDERICQLLPY
jgi:hypothetical protein